MTNKDFVKGMNKARFIHWCVDRHNEYVGCKTLHEVLEGKQNKIKALDDWMEANYDQD